MSGSASKAVGFTITSLSPQCDTILLASPCSSAWLKGRTLTATFTTLLGRGGGVKINGFSLRVVPFTDAAPLLALFLVGVGRDESFTAALELLLRGALDALRGAGDEVESMLSRTTLFENSIGLSSNGSTIANLLSMGVTDTDSTGE